jgi:hypothetical protein
MIKNILFIFALVNHFILSAQTYQWAKSIGGLAIGNTPQRAYALATDPTGNVYMTGRFQGTSINFNPGSSPVLLSSTAGNGASVVYFGKYSAGGNCVWAKAIAGASGLGLAIGVDGSGNVLIAGGFGGSNIDFDPGPGTATFTALSFDIFLAKYDNTGNYLWAKVIGGSGNENATGISLDASGNVYMTGRFQSTVDFDPGAGVANLNSVGSDDIFLAKYSANGSYLWAGSIGSTGLDISNAVGTDALGNAYITGYFQGAATDFDPGPGTATLSSSGNNIYFAKYNSNGNYVWAKVLFGSAGFSNSLSADPIGNIYIGGGFSNSIDFDPGSGVVILNTGSNGAAAFFAKYDSTGAYLLAKSIVGGAVGIQSITKNAQGKIFIAGQFSGVSDFDPGPGTFTLSPTSTNQADVFFAKYDAAGNYIWAKQINAPGGSDYCNAVALDGFENVFIAGAYFGANADFDVGPGTATFTPIYVQDLFLAKYGYCNVQTSSQRSICAGGSYAINGHTYTAAGLYADTLYTNFGCDSIINTQLVLSTQQGTLALNSNSILCTGISNTLIASGALTYTWSNGAQTPSVVVTPTATTPYFVNGKDLSGCILSNSVGVYASPSLSVFGRSYVCRGEQALLTVSGASSYTWNTGAQTPSIVVAPIGISIYTVTGMGSNSSCKSQKSFTVIAVSCLDFNSLAQNVTQLSIYPNPATNELFYTLNTSGTHSYKITDFMGGIVLQGNQSGNSVRLDLNTLTPGIYNLTITVGKSAKTVRFLKE